MPARRPGSATAPGGALGTHRPLRSPPRWRARPRRISTPARLLEPVERPGDGLLPVFVVLVALRRVHLRLPALVLAPVLAQVLLAVPEASGEARGVSGSKRRGLRDLWTDDRH